MPQIPSWLLPSLQRPDQGAVQLPRVPSPEPIETPEEFLGDQDVVVVRRDEAVVKFVRGRMNEAAGIEHNDAPVWATDTNLKGATEAFVGSTF